MEVIIYGDEPEIAQFAESTILYNTIMLDGSVQNDNC